MDVTAIVLAGGFATRLRPLTLTKPKPLLPVLDRPLLDWILEGLEKAGIKRVILSVRYMADKIKERYGSGFNSLELEFVEEDRPLGDAGPIRLVDTLIGLTDTFLVVNGDIFTNIDFAEVIRYHKRVGAVATIVLTEVDDPSRYGVAVIDEDTRITRFVEKPPRDQAPSNLVNAGIYVFEREVLKYIPETRERLKIAKHVLPKLVEEGKAYGYLFKGLWRDIGVPRDYLLANIEALEYYYPRGYVSHDAEVSEEAEIQQPVYIAPYTRIAPGARIGPYTIICSRVVVESKALVERSIIMQKSRIEESSVIRSSIIGEGCFIDRWARVEEGSVIGDEVIIAERVYIAPRTVILPFKEVESSIYREGSIVL